MFGFEKLEVWQESIGFVDAVYSATRGFPKGDSFGLAKQMRNAAVSVSSSIAEGSSRDVRHDSSRFVEIATHSLFKVVSLASISRNKGLLSEDEFQILYAVSEDQGRILGGLRRSLQGDR